MIGEKNDGTNGSNGIFGAVGGCEGQKHQSQIASCGVASKGDPGDSLTSQSAVTRLEISNGGGKRVLRGEPVIWYESVDASVRRDVAGEVSERFGISPIEPAAMHMQNRGPLLSAPRLGPPFAKN